ncbi:hypothetical protein CPB85DRAFT_1220362, partial [Mucidula mucida]
WAFPMERYCGFLKKAITSHCFPWAQLDNHTIYLAQIAQCVLSIISIKQSHLNVLNTKPNVLTSRL